ncbi:hypothetical protein AB0H49_13225 [Nocardia sp. NPDC050713]
MTEDPVAYRAATESFLRRDFLRHTVIATGIANFTDLANPTSNKIYRAIGYRAVHDFANYVFE